MVVALGADVLFVAADAEPELLEEPFPNNPPNKPLFPNKPPNADDEDEVSLSDPEAGKLAL